MNRSKAWSIAPSATEPACHTDSVTPPDRPDDRRIRNDALAKVGVRLVVAGIPSLIIGAIAWGLGLPWWLVLLALLVILWFAVFEA